MSYAMTYPVGLGIDRPTYSRQGTLRTCLRKIASDIMPNVPPQNTTVPARNTTVPPRNTTVPPRNTAKPLDFFGSMGSIWNFLVARLRMWWFKNRIKSGQLTQDQWKTVHADAKELSTNRFGRAMGSFINPAKYDNGYFAGLPQFMRGVQRAHEFSQGVYNSDDNKLTQDRNDVRHMYNYGNKYGFFDDSFNKKYKDKINFVTNPHINNTMFRLGGTVNALTSNAQGRK